MEIHALNNAVVASLWLQTGLQGLLPVNQGDATEGVMDIYGQIKNGSCLNASNG